MKKLFRFDFVRFCLVGSTGFLINFALLTALYKWLSVPLFVAQLIASEISLFSNFMLHSRWTYARKNVKKSFPQLLWQFHASSWTAIIGSALLVSLCVHVLHLDYIVALILSSGIALVWNFSWTKYFIWREGQAPPTGDSQE